MAQTLVSQDSITPWFKNARHRTKQSKLLFHYIFSTIPYVEKLLAYWEWEASLCPNPELRKQALSSLQNKKFHCQGGAFFSTPRTGHEKILVELIVAYQTLCDYLDNLCDRANCTDEKAFFQLHTSLLDALSPETVKHDYYRDYPYQDDGGYMNKLVDECQRRLAQLPSYSSVSDDAIHLAQLYISLQAYKHIDLERREEVLIEWANSCLKPYHEMLWQEFAAASGSTLGIFALFAMASKDETGPAAGRDLVKIYFPWICGLHILLDYLIDQEEDRQGGDLNFTFYYKDQSEMKERLQFFIQNSITEADNMPDMTFTRTIIEGLLAMYLSDRKVKEQAMDQIATDLVKTAGGGTAATLHLCQMVRKYYRQF